MTWRLLMLMAGNYSGKEAIQQSTTLDAVAPH
jgi:hypothetical protein